MSPGLASHIRPPVSEYSQRLGSVPHKASQKSVSESRLAKTQRGECERSCQEGRKKGRKAVPCCTSDQKSAGVPLSEGDAYSRGMGTLTWSGVSTLHRCTIFVQHVGSCEGVYVVAGE